MLLLLALLVQDQPVARDLESRLREMEVAIVALDRRIEAAFQEKDYDAAEQLYRQSAEKRQERDKLRAELEKRRHEPLPHSLTGDMAIAFNPRWTYFERSLELDDAIGVGVELAFRRSLFVELRWWEADDVRTGGDADLVELYLGFQTSTRLLQKETAELVTRIGFGRAWMRSDGPDGDREGPFAFTAGLLIRSYISGGVRTGAGFDVDILYTDFNRGGNAWETALSLRVSIEVGF